MSLQPEQGVARRIQQQDGSGRKGVTTHGSGEIFRIVGEAHGGDGSF